MFGVSCGCAGWRPYVATQTEPDLLKTLSEGLETTSQCSRTSPNKLGISVRDLIVTVPCSRPTLMLLL